MTVINEPLNLGDLLKYEEDCLRYSREIATVSAGQKLALGTVVGRETVSAKLRQFDPLAIQLNRADWWKYRQHGAVGLAS